MAETSVGPRECALAANFAQPLAFKEGQGSQNQVRLLELVRDFLVMKTFQARLLLATILHLIVDLK